MIRLLFVAILNYLCVYCRPEYLEGKGQFNKRSIIDDLIDSKTRKEYLWNSDFVEIGDLKGWDSQFDSNDDLISEDIISDDIEHRKYLGEWESDKINSMPLSFTEPSKWSLPFHGALKPPKKKYGKYKVMEQWKSDKNKMKPMSFMQRPYQRAPNKTPKIEWKLDEIKAMDFTERPSKWSLSFQRTPNKGPTELKKATVSQRIKDLRNIASLQKKIISALKKVELKSKRRKNCSLHYLVEQRAALADLESDASRLTLRGYYDEPIYQPVIDQSKEMVMAKRARIIQLVQELNNFKHLDSETNNIVNSINSLQLELCMEEAMELEDTSKKLRKKVEDKRRYVLDILSNLLKEKGIPEEKDVSLVFLNTEKQESSLVQVAGKANYARCKRCEDLDDEEVCGDNGQTYRSLCHAVNCAGLALRDISAGSCATKDPCARADCSSSQTCIPIVHGTCLALYSSNGLKKLPCSQYICVKEDVSCDNKNFSDVCGKNGKTYNSLCELYKAGKQLAYTGPCRPLCKGEVCGTDKNTYKSACHAHARNIRIDYTGKCSSRNLGSRGKMLTCKEIRKFRLCQKEALCNRPVLPINVCCPICGATAEVDLTSKALRKFMSDHKEKNHLYVLENMLREMLPPYAVKKCDLTGSLTNKGNVSLILEAVNPGDHQLCQDALKVITNTINSFHGQSRRDVGNFELAPFLSFESWLNDQVVNFQDKILGVGDDLGNQAYDIFGDTIQNLDDSVSSRGMKITTYTFVIVSIINFFHFN